MLVKLYSLIRRNSTRNLRWRMISCDMGLIKSFLSLFRKLGIRRRIWIEGLNGRGTDREGGGILFFISTF